MLASELPWATRVSCAAAFAAVYGTHRTRVWLGDRRRRLAGRMRRADRSRLTGRS
jgi:hypothetical protein